jgi:AraC-like DNA-binding protein
MVRIDNDIFKKNLVVGRSWPALRDVKVLAAGTKVEPPGATFGPRLQFCWEFIWVREGSLTARVDDVAVEGSPGTVLLIPPRAVDVYDWSPRERTSHSFLHFDFAAPAAGWPERAAWPLKRQLRQTHPLLALFEHLIGVVLDSEPLAGALMAPSVELMLRLFLLEGAQSGARGARVPELVERCLVYVRDQIADSPTQQLTLGQLAAQTHVSPQHLCRVFKHSLALGPMEVVRLLRIDHSVTYLERTQLQVKEIARRCGFSNAFHYSKVFRGAFGLSPTAYRAAFERGHVVRTISPVLRRLAAQRVIVDEPQVNDYIRRVAAAGARRRASLGG